MKWYLLRWLVCWAELVDGLLGVLTFGAWPWYLSPKAENMFLDYSDRQFFLKPPRGKETEDGARCDDRGCYYVSGRGEH